MTDEEFERIKKAEKDQLRAKQRFQETLEALKKQNKVQSAVRRMSSAARRLFRENEEFVDRVRSWTARQAARLEVAMDADPALEADRDDLAEAEEELREARADELVRQYKKASGTRSAQTRRDVPSAAEDDAAEERDDEASMPDKTIGRMRDEPPSHDT